MRIVLYKDAVGWWRWRLVARNGEIISTGQAHRRKWNAKRSARLVAPDAPIEVVP